MLNAYQHALSRRGFVVDDAGPFKSDLFKLGMRDDLIDHTHLISFLGAVGQAQKEGFRARF